MKNIEFYNTPEGEVMIKEEFEPVRMLTDKDRNIIESMITIIRDRYPEAFKALAKNYSVTERNRLRYEFLIVHRFIRCNFGEYDQYNYDINNNGDFKFEEVHCPLRGECKHEGVICKPCVNTNLSDREKEVLKLIAEGEKREDIAEKLFISPGTVNRHRENIRAKIQAKNTADMVNYYNNHFKE